MTVNDPVPWHNETIGEEKRKRRQCERRWSRTGIIIHRAVYVSQRNLVNQLIYQAKVDILGQDQVLWKGSATAVQGCG